MGFKAVPGREGIYRLLKSTIFCNFGLTTLDVTSKASYLVGISRLSYSAGIFKHDIVAALFLGFRKQA